MIIISKETEKHTLEKIYPISILEADRMYALKPAVLLNYMQDIASKSINNCSSLYSFRELYQKGLTWFLVRYRLEFDDYPVKMDKIKIQTESRGCVKLNARRDFEGFDVKTGNRLFRATSSWYIVDLKTKSVVNIHQQYPNFSVFEKREDDLNLRKLKSLTNPDYQKIFHVRYEDLDFNGHVNNTIYITWALEALNYDFRVSNKLKNLDIYFKHEVKYGDNVISMVKIHKENNVTEHLIKIADTGEEVCLIRCEFVKE